VAPPALWLFALILGVAVGLLIRRTLPAMAVTLVLFPAVMLGLGAIGPYYAATYMRRPVSLDQRRTPCHPRSGHSAGGYKDPTATPSRPAQPYGSARTPPRRCVGMNPAWPNTTSRHWSTTNPTAGSGGSNGLKPASCPARLHQRQA
jgi:hypothetical protein